MNMAFQIEVLTNSEGVREMVRIECDPTADVPGDGLEAEELGAGAWEFLFVLPEDFDGTESVFRHFRRYGLDADDVVTACKDAMAAAA